MVCQRYKHFARFRLLRLLPCDGVTNKRVSAEKRMDGIRRPNTNLNPAKYPAKEVFVLLM
jgi:hypothetical protein